MRRVARSRRGARGAVAIAVVAVAAVAAVALGAGCGLPAAVRRGDEFVTAGKYADAEAAYVSAAERAPVEAWRGACRARMYLGKLEAALEACGKSIAASEAAAKKRGGDAAKAAEEAGALVLKGRVLRAMGRHVEAVAALEAARAAASDDREVVAWLGIAYADALERGKALSTVRAWTDLRPDNPVRWAELASIQSYVYDLDDAEASWRKVMELDPAGSSAAAYAGLAESFLMRGKADEARRAAETAIDHDPKQPYAGTILARALALAGSPDLAKARLELSAPAGTRALPALLARGEVGRATGDAGSAKEALEAAAGIDATDERVHFLLGWLHEVRGDLEAAVRAYERAIAIRPFYLEARYRLAMMLGAADPRGKAALLEFLRHARDVGALRKWVDEAMAKLPADALAPATGGGAGAGAGPASAPGPGPEPEPVPGP